jgi:hypothetical protein
MEHTMATRTNRRTTARATPASPAADRRPVEDLLHEIAYVLHVTRKVSPQVVWPVAPRARAAEDARVTASA